MSMALLHDQKNRIMSPFENFQKISFIVFEIKFAGKNWKSQGK